MIQFRGILCIVLIFWVATTACNPIPQAPGAGSAGIQEQECGPFPVRFRDTVMNHVFATYPGDRVLRNVVVRPPSVGLLPINGEDMAGYVGRVRFSLKSEEQQAYIPVTYCYFLRNDAVLAFEDAREANWCAQGAGE